MQNIAQREEAGVAVVLLGGELTLPYAAELREALLPLQATGLPLRLDLAAVEELDLPAMQVLLALRGDCLRAGRGFTLCDAPSGIWSRTLERAGISLTTEETL